MKLALFSDIHANRQAFEACLSHSRQQGAEQWAFLGDLVGYGGDPVCVLDQIQQLVQRGAWIVQGNHDAMAVNPPTQSTRQGEATAAWTHAQLSPTHLEFLRTLPLTAQVGSLLLVHASADAPSQWRYVDDTRSALASLDAATATHPEVRHVFGGHVHQQTLYYRGSGRGLMPFTPTPGVPIHTPAHRRWIATVGSVGQPRDGKPLAMYAMFDVAQKTLTFHRVPYNHMGAAAAVRRAGLPEYFAQRLEEGR
jgi:diadenosine tetraphosphatase ApaH/serine/threonine PP2A family protein phosphatase